MDSHLTPNPFPLAARVHLLQTCCSLIFIGECSIRCAAILLLLVERVFHCTIDICSWSVCTTIRSGSTRQLNVSFSCTSKTSCSDFNRLLSLVPPKRCFKDRVGLLNYDTLNDVQFPPTAPLDCTKGQTKKALVVNHTSCTLSINIHIMHTNGNM